MEATAPAPVIAEVQLGSFRCFGSASFQPGAGFNLIAGPNASGKTSVLEAIYVLGRGSSFRAARAEAAVQFDADRATLFAHLGAGPTSRVGVEIVRGEGLGIRVDGEPGNRADLARALPVQVLDPASHELVSGAPAVRRQFLDWGVFHVEHAFLPAWQRYRRALQQRNAALKTRNGPAAWAWDESLSSDGVLVAEFRRHFVSELQLKALPIAEALLRAELELDYQPGWADGMTLATALEASRERDLHVASSQVGPHRADLRISLRTRRARDTVSRGQEKLVAAALTLAQLELVAQGLQRPVVLLVDEPGADLDRQHLGLLMAAVASAPAQTFVTALLPDAFELPAGAHAFHVELEEGQAAILSRL